MTTQTSAHTQLAEKLIELHKEPAKYIALASMIMTAVLKVHPEEMSQMYRIGIDLLTEFTKDQFRKALAVVEETKGNIMSGKTSCNGFSKDYVCNMYDETIAFMKYHFIDD